MRMILTLLICLILANIAEAKEAKVPRPFDFPLSAAAGTYLVHQNQTADRYQADGRFAQVELVRKTPGEPSILDFTFVPKKSFGAIELRAALLVDVQWQKGRGILATFWGPGNFRILSISIPQRMLVGYR